MQKRNHVNKRCQKSVVGPPFGGVLAALLLLLQPLWQNLPSRALSCWAGEKHPSEVIECEKCGEKYDYRASPFHHSKNAAIKM